MQNKSEKIEILNYYSKIGNFWVQKSGFLAILGHFWTPFLKKFRAWFCPNRQFQGPICHFDTIFKLLHNKANAISRTLTVPFVILSLHCTFFCVTCEKTCCIAKLCIFVQGYYRRGPGTKKMAHFCQKVRRNFTMSMQVTCAPFADRLLLKFPLILRLRKKSLFCAKNAKNCKNLFKKIF